MNAILLALLKYHKEHMRFLASFGEDNEKPENKESAIREDLKEIIEYMKSKEIGGVFGGICFENKDYTIFLQCCCDVSGWRQRERRGIPSIEYRECDLEYFYEKLRNDMYEFTYGPLRKRISGVLPGREDEFCQG